MIYLSRALAIFVVLAIVSVGGLSPAHAQEATEPPTSPPGFDNPDDVTDIDQYRLPSWSFTTVLLNLSGGARRGSNSSERDIVGSPEDRSTVTGLRLNLAPSLETFTESEDRRFRLNLTPTLRVRGGGNTDEENNEQVSESDFRRVETALDINVDLTEYVAGDLFLQARTDNAAKYNRRTFEATTGGMQARDALDLEVDYSSRTRLGIGFGRLRDVTPVIRALRVRERLKELGRADVLSSDNVQAAARQFARRPGYAPIYDRGDKYFWSDFFSGIESQSTDLLPYESFYLAESLVEQVARRQEGYEVSAGVDLSYSSRLEKQDRAFGADERRRSINSSVGLFTEGRYATNLSLRQQITVFGGVEYAIPTEENTTINGFLETRLGGEHLWEIADRYQLITSATARYGRRIPEQGDARTQFDGIVSSDFAVFVENNVRLNAGLDYSFQRSSSGTFRQTATGLRFSFGVNYFLFRGLK